METKLAPGILIASPHLRDPNFNETVVLMFEHGESGAVGLVVNRTLDIGLDQVIEDLDITAEAEIEESVQYGGPVSMEIGWVVHSSDWREPTTRDVVDGVCISTSRDVLEAIAAGSGPSRYMLCLGYAGWAGGQLEDEVAAGAWLSVPLDPALVFDTPVGDRWRECYARLGIDPHQLATTVGNA